MLWSWRPSRRDGVVSWAVAAASFVSIFLSMGLSFGSIGVMTVAFGEQFGSRASDDELSWIGGIRLCFVFLTGIVSSVLVNRFGARSMQAVGCAIAALAVGLSTLATELWHLYVAFGAVAGAGLSLVFTASSVVVEGHFDRYLHVALPLSQLGDTVGYSAFPVLTQYLLDSIGLRGTLLLFCGLTGVPLLCSAFYFAAVEPPADAGASGPQQQPPPAATTEAALANGVNHKAARKGASNAAYATEDEPDIVLTSIYWLPGCRVLGSADDAVELSQVYNGDSARAMSDRAASATLASADASAPPPADARSPSGGAPTIVAVADGDKGHVAAAEDPDSRRSQRARLRRLLARGDVWLLLLNMFGWQYTSSSIFVLLPTYITRSGLINKDEAALGVTLVGVANVVGNVVTVLAALRTYNHALLLAVSCLLFGVGVMLYALTAASLAAYYSVSAFNGFWLGITLGLTMSLIVDFADGGGMTDLFGLVTFSSGLGGLAGPGITGVIQTRVSDAVGLYVSGAVSLVAFVALLAPAIRRRHGSAVTRPA